ncbi:carbohydrate ABC transporter substrate-binding protein (CUT1 family) [Pseudonocardia hierapolitana]|uniref:Carbohydrate ABC transporter substrate-binding protein (CUT1 family) n=1 Tax=Pseudonocardia hierapolitana TaxID=1128676 RepID=A0A561T5N8_9PSEU|nr:extracellular solute-binding protein [Pseudonocardia hierapolitana]TWF82424.1 carbohydrate ABC transporter substrate-binding protein (CUT1 family) [Pseudonocardia hierapolitana]
MLGRRAFGAAAAALALLLSGCGGGSDEGGPVTLRFSWWGSDPRHEYTQRIIDIYQSEHPGVTIEPSFTGFADYWDRLATEVAGGEAPDVIQHETRYVREYADRGALLDLNQYVPGIIRTEKLDPSVMQTGVIDGEMFAIPIGINAHAVIADPQLFADLGVPMPDDRTWTYDDMIATAAAISEAGPDGTWGYQMTTAIDTSFEIFARQRGEALFDEQGDIGFRRETLVAWWAHQLRFHEIGAAPPAAQTIELENADADGSLFATHQGALGTVWTNGLLTLDKVSGRELKLLRFPGEGTEQQAGMYFKPSMFWSASSRTEHPEEAARFIDFLLNDPRVADIMLSERGLPVNVEQRERILGQLNPADQQAAAFLEEIEPDIAPPPPLPPQGAGEVQGIMQQLNEQVLFGQMTVEQAADEFMTQVNAATS